MAIFTNQAALTYNGTTVTSNIVTGELLQTLTLTKYALRTQYTTGSTVAYAVQLINSGTSALTGLTLTDNLGAYTVLTTTRTPLSYVDGTVRYYINGVLQTAPTVTAGPPLTISGLSVPAGGNAAILYEATPNQFAPLTAGSTIVNTASVTGAFLTAAVEDQETITVSRDPQLSISKAISPASVSPGGQLTYTFTIENAGNTAAVATDQITLTDTFSPILRNLSVTFNGTVWAPTTNYTYDASTGLFATVAGQIVVPAASYAQSVATGEWLVTPGISNLTVTGTVG